MGSRRFVHELLIRRGAASQAWITELFPEQKSYVLDSAKLLAACCSRRSGKSYGNAYRLKRAGDRHPNEMSLYVALSKNNARSIVGKALVDLSRKWRWSVTLKEIDGRLHAIMPNGHHVWLAGARHRADFEQFRGYKFAEIQIDEAQLYPFLGEVIDDVLEPAVGDLDGSIVLSGTPSPIPVGFFHDVTTGEGTDVMGRPIPRWPTHHWTLAENLFFRGGKGAEYREELRLRRGWALDHPTLQREYYGVWVRDEGALVFPYDPAINSYNMLPEGLDWRSVLGVDLGASQEERSTAFTIPLFCHDDPHIYVSKSWKQAGMIPSQIAAKIEELRRDISPSSIVIDAGGLGGGYVEEFNQRFGKYAQPAQKQHKMAYVEMMRGDLKSGVIKIDPFHNRDLLDEMQVLQWNEERDGFDDRFPDHVCESLLYSWREARTHYRPKDTAAPEPGSPEWHDAETRKRKAELERKVLEKSRQRFKKQGFR